MVNLERLHELSDAELEAAWAAAEAAIHHAPDDTRSAAAMRDARRCRSHAAFFIADEIKRRARGDRA